MHLVTVVTRYLVKSAFKVFLTCFLHATVLCVLLNATLSQLNLRPMPDADRTSQQGIGFASGFSVSPAAFSQSPPTAEQAWRYIHQQADALCAYKDDLEATGITDPSAHVNFINREMALQDIHASNAQ